MSHARQVKGDNLTERDTLDLQENPENIITYESTTSKTHDKPRIKKKNMARQRLEQR